MACVACAGHSHKTTEKPLPIPGDTGKATASRWSIQPWKGTASYIFSRRGVVTSDSADDTPRLSEVNGRETLARSPTLKGFRSSLAEAPFPPGTQKVVGTLHDGRLSVETDMVAEPRCDPVRAQLRGDLEDLELPLSATISLGQSWSDSVSIVTCVSGIPGIAQSVRHFMAGADTVADGLPAIRVQRRDSTTGRATGTLEQHAVSLSVEGSATAEFLLSASSGKVLRFAKQRLLHISVIAAGRPRTFVQQSTTVFELAR